MSTIVIMPGGFHPFHAGHFALYQSALKAFPGAEVYVAATNDQSERPFPFSLKEKLAKLAGVQAGHFVQVKSPFQAKEITQHYNPEQDVLIFVRSEKDKNESPKPGGIKKDGTPAYFQPWTGKDVQPFAKHAYFAYLPTVEFGPGITSATQIRKAWPTLNDKRKLALVMSLYPAAQKNPKLAQNVVGMFDQVMGGQVEEGWKEKAGAAALAGAMATGASGVVLNPARPIGPATATRPAPTVANPNPAAHPLSPLNPSSPTYVAKAKVVNIHGKEYLRHELPQDMSKVTKTTDDAGNEIYAWTEKSGMRPQYTYRWFAPVQSVKEQGVAEGAPIVVMPRADRLKKPEPTKVRYQGDIVPPTQPPSTEKRGVKGRPGQRPMPKYDDKLDEGLGDYITKKIDDFLDIPKISSHEVSRLMKNAPKQLPNDVAEKLVAKFMETEKAKRLAQQAADAKKTTVEKIIPYLTFFAREFVDRWERIPQRDKDNALKNLVYNIGRFLMFVLESLLKGLVKRESIEESKTQIKVSESADYLDEK